VAYNLKKVSAFDVTTKEWQSLETFGFNKDKFPAARKCQGSVQLGNGK
jgi:hypothetical protein